MTPAVEAINDAITSNLPNSHCGSVVQIDEKDHDVRKDLLTSPPRPCHIIEAVQRPVLTGPYFGADAPAAAELSKFVSDSALSKNVRPSPTMMRCSQVGVQL